MMKNFYTSLTGALPAAAILGLLFGGAVQTAAAERQQQPPVTQPPAPTAPQPPPAQPPQVQPPSQVPPATPDPATPAPPATQPPATGTAGQTAQTTATNQSTPSGGAVVLLDRISDLVDQALGAKSSAKASDKGTPGAKGTSGVLKVGKSGAGTVSVERATLDEIKAEIDQLRIMLKDKQP